MSLRYKVSLFISLLFLISGGASIAVNQFVILPSFLELERQLAERNTQRAVEAVHRDLEVLSTNVTAWAWWDESKRYMEGANSGFVERELSAEPVASAEVSYMGFYRSDGTQVIHRAPILEQAGGADLGVLQDASLPASHPLLQHPDLRGDAKGLVSTPSGPMLVASRPIITSSGAGPAAGVLIFGRMFDATTVERIADQYKLDLTIAPATAAPALSSVERSVALAGTGEPKSLTPIRIEQVGEKLVGEATIADFTGAPILTLHVATPSEISARGERASRFALLTLCAVALTVLGVMLSLLHVTVLSPIANLTAHAVDVGTNDALHKRLTLDRTDELGVLATEFNRMTDHLVEARQRLVDQSFVLGKADMAAGILHNLGNAVTPITVRLNTLTDQMKDAPLDDLDRAMAELEDETTTPQRQASLRRFVDIANVEMAALMRSVRADIVNVAGQVEHVQQILAEQERYSRAGGVGEAVDIAQIVRQVANGLDPEFQQIAVIKLDPSVRAIGAVRGPRVEIQQVVGNLILNAAESIRSHCISDGRIAVSATREDKNGRAQTHLVFQDNGSGIDPSDLGRIFERRFSTKKRGSGLGLHWSANAVAAMGGALFTESSGIGQGATVHLILPLAENDDPAAGSEGMR